MKFYNRIKSLITGKPYFQVKENHNIIPAFISGGVQYYQFDDIFNLASGRAFTANAFYNELSMRCTREYLIAHTEATENLLNDKKAKLTDLAMLNAQLKERLTLIVEADIVMKLASVVFFTIDELPYEYDFKYNLEKIAKWKKEGLDAFFLSKQLSSYNPFSDISQEDFEMFTKVGEKMNEKHLSALSLILSEIQKNSDYYKTLDLQKQVISA